MNAFLPGLRILRHSTLLCDHLQPDIESLEVECLWFQKGPSPSGRQPGPRPGSSGPDRRCPADRVRCRVGGDAADVDEGVRDDAEADPVHSASRWKDSHVSSCPG
jgi:hypothetical protein